jgi:hypothetical protein
MSDESFVFNKQLDGRFLNSIYEGDKEHAKMIFSKFVNSVNGYLAEIEQGYNSGNAEIFRKAIHKFKPVLSFVGLTKLTGSAEVIEKKCNGITDVNTLSGLYIPFKTELKEMIPVIETDLMKMKALTS